MKEFVCAVVFVAATICVQGVGDTTARCLYIQSAGAQEGQLSQAILVWTPFEQSGRRTPPLSFGNPTPDVRAVQRAQPPVPTAKDLAECKAVMDAEGHGPDPGSEEWWAACERLRARGGAPSFDCSKASGQVEELVCSDPELAALDVELARLYQAISASATSQELNTLRTYQRGWIKGRNDCWKAVRVSVRACVEASYRDRIRELRLQF